MRMEDRLVSLFCKSEPIIYSSVSSPLHKTTVSVTSVTWPASTEAPTEPAKQHPTGLGLGSYQVLLKQGGGTQFLDQSLFLDPGSRESCNYLKKVNPILFTRKFRLHAIANQSKDQNV